MWDTSVKCLIQIKTKYLLKTVAPIESLIRANFTGSLDINSGNSGHFQAID